MANGLGSLARGFVQGSQLGMQMKREERAAESQSELSELRKAAEGRAQETHEQNLTLRELQEKRAGSAESRAVSQEKRALSQEERAKSAEGRAVKQSERLTAESDWRIGKEKRAEVDKKLASVAPIEYQRVAQGGDFSPEFMDEAKGTRFDPVYMAKPEFSKAAKTAYNYVGDLMEKVKTEGASSIGIADVNKPEFLQSLGVLMAPDIKRGIGEKDAVTGKTVTDKKIATIIPYENQGLVVEVEVTLDDGTSYTAPITEGRSRDPDDPVKIVPVDKFIDNLQGYALMASAYNQPDLQSAVSRYTGTPAKPNSSAEVTKRQYLRELGDIDRDEAKELAKLESDELSDPATKAESIKAVGEKYQGLRERTNARYNIKTPDPVGKGSAKVQQPRGGGQKVIDVDSWAQGDPKKQAFIKSGEEYALESGESPFDAFSPSELEKLYMDWSNEQEADALAELMSQ